MATTGNLRLGVEQRGTLAMTPTLRQAIGFLSMSNVALSARLADLQTKNPGLVPLLGQQRQSWLTLTRQVAPPQDRAKPQAPSLTGGFGGVDTNRIAEHAPALISHVTAQLPHLVRRKADLPVAEVFLMALEPSGWLGATTAEVAEAAGVSVAQAEDVLHQLQAVEPTGLFARSLSECLRLQAVEQDLLTEAFRRLLDNLPLLAAGRLDDLAEVCGTDLAEVEAMAQALRRMNPKPGAGFSQSSVIDNPPDLLLQRDGEGWLLELNRDTAPQLRVESAGASVEAWREARMIVQALDRRNSTVLTIAAEIVSRQDAHLRGAGPLAAVTIGDLAKVTGLHRSTVSRVTAALFLSTPRRTLPLRDLLCAAAPPARRLKDPLSVHAVLEKMRAIVAAEDPASPLSDADIAELLLQEGAALARRTVVKYRGLAGIPPRAARSA